MEEVKIKRGRGRPKKDERYMKETASWNVRIKKSLLKRFKVLLQKKKRVLKEKVYANTIISELLETYVTSQETEELNAGWKQEREEDLKRKLEELEQLKSEIKEIR